MSGNKQDLAVLLESDTLELVRIQGIFLVASFALFAFSSKGKVFSIISLLISFTINITLVINYYMERNRIGKLGFYPKRITEIIAVIMIIVALFTLWILYEVWRTPPATSIGKLVEDIETKIEDSNKVNAAQLNENLKQIEDNRKLIESLNGNINGNIPNGKRETLKRSLTNKQDLSKILSSDQTQKLSGQNALLKLENVNRNKTIATDSVLAAVA
jgi:hypothetical protein